MECVYMYLFFVQCLMYVYFTNEMKVPHIIIRNIEKKLFDNCETLDYFSLSCRKIIALSLYFCLSYLLFMSILI